MKDFVKETRVQIERAIFHLENVHNVTLLHYRSIFCISLPFFLSCLPFYDKFDDTFPCNLNQDDSIG